MPTLLFPPRLTLRRRAKLNSIYYATDDPDRPRSHDSGVDVEVGRPSSGDLMIVQGLWGWTGAICSSAVPANGRFGSERCQLPSRTGFRCG